jgi:hypothetical protein
MIGRSVMGLAMCAIFVSANAQQNGSVQMSGKYLATGTTVTVEIFDNNCNKSLGTFSVSGPNGLTPVSPICINSSGYINIKDRVPPNGNWIMRSFLKSGDEFSPQ